MALALHSWLLSRLALCGFSPQLFFPGCKETGWGFLRYCLTLILGQSVEEETKKNKPKNPQSLIVEMLYLDLEDRLNPTGDTV